MFVNQKVFTSADENVFVGMQRRGVDLSWHSIFADLAHGFQIEKHDIRSVAYREDSFIIGNFNSSRNVIECQFENLRVGPLVPKSDSPVVACADKFLIIQTREYHVSDIVRVTLKHLRFFKVGNT